MDEHRFIDSVLRPFAGIGSEGLDDDCAWIEVGERWLVVSTDTSVEGVHFPRSVQGAAATERAVRVALSDIYAKAAEPIGFVVAVSAPRSADDLMMRAYGAGLEQVSLSLGVPMLGGDTVRHGGVLSVTVTAIGWAPRKLLRSGAACGDNIWVSGAIGPASLGLRYLQGDVGLPDPTGDELVSWEEAFLRPTVGAVAALEWATSSIDVSDGLLADLNHIADASGVRCEISSQSIPFGPAQRYAEIVGAVEDLVTAGDDYAVVFTSKPSAVVGGATRIGTVKEGSGVCLLDGRGRDITPAKLGYSHSS